MPAASFDGGFDALASGRWDSLAVEDDDGHTDRAAPYADPLGLPLFCPRLISWFSFFNRLNSPIHCSSVRLRTLGTRTVFSSQSVASPVQK
jgi:hypothetical protein